MLANTPTCADVRDRRIPGRTVHGFRVRARWERVYTCTCGATTIQDLQSSNRRPKPGAVKCVSCREYLKR
jgi:predicted SprT family Zn-dependent metalloprotease